MNHDLTIGETNLMVRALRYYMSCEQDAIQAAWLKARAQPTLGKHTKEAANATKLAREAKEHIEAAKALLDKLRPSFAQKEKA